MTLKNKLIYFVIIIILSCNSKDKSRKDTYYSINYYINTKEIRTGQVNINREAQMYNCQNNTLNFNYTAELSGDSLLTKFYTSNSTAKEIEIIDVISEFYNKSYERIYVYRGIYASTDADFLLFWNKKDGLLSYYSVSSMKFVIIKNNFIGLSMPLISYIFTEKERYIPEPPID